MKEFLRKFLLFCFLFFMTYTVQGNVTFDWDDNASPPSTSFNVTFIREGTGEKVTYSTPASSITIRPPKSGKYEVQVTAVRDGLESEPCSSLDSTCARLEDGTPGEWKAYWRPAGPGGPMVIQ